MYFKKYLTADHRGLFEIKFSELAGNANTT